MAVIARRGHAFGTGQADHERRGKQKHHASHYPQAGPEAAEKHVHEHQPDQRRGQKRRRQCQSHDNRSKPALPWRARRHQWP